MKKLTFALFVAFGATMFVSCGPKIDTPENLGKSLLEAMSSQDKEAFTELFATKEDYTAYLDQAAKSQMPDSIKNKFDEVKTKEISRFDEYVTNQILPSYDKTNEYAQKANVNWEKAEFVSFESKEDNDFNMKRILGKVYFKTDTGSNFYLKFTALQIGDDWKIVDVDGFRVKKD
jgi:hypothetical protein